MAPQPRNLLRFPSDLVSSLTSGNLKFQLTELSAIPRAAVAVEERYSQVFKLDHVRPSVVADGIAECQIRFSTVPIVFCETRKLAQEWVYRFLAAAHRAVEVDADGQLAVDALAGAPELAPPPPTLAEIRTWARENGYAVSDRGRVSRAVREAFEAAAGKP